MNRIPARQRRSARVILLDEAHRVLLIRFGVVRRGADFVFWATPGGSIEPDEAPLAAALREVAEELGLELGLTGPVHETHDRYEHEGPMVENTDVFFLGRCCSTEPTLRRHTDAERKAMRGLRWWTVEEIEASSATIFPSDLAALVRRCQGQASAPSCPSRNDSTA